jgi:predicted nucleic acid-binding protein
MEIKSILLDTNAYTAFKRNQNEAITIIQTVDIIAINTVIIGELLGGFAVGNKQEKNRYELEQFLKSNRVKILTIDLKTSEYYAMIYSELRKKGKPIPTNDIWIAATAIQHDLILFTYDSDFKNIRDIKLGNCLADFIDKK